MQHLHILNEKGSAITPLLIALRDKTLQQDASRFRENLKKVGRLMAFELSKSFDFRKEDVTTPLGVAMEWQLNEKVVVISILRAASSMAEGFTDTLPEAEIGMIGAMRKEGNEVDIDLSYIAIPDISNKRVIIVDPMLATGKSMVKTVDTLLQKGTPAKVDIACLVAAPEGIDYLNQNISIQFELWTCAKDKCLNDQFYIVPGLGDAGDLAFGRKK